MTYSGGRSDRTCWSLRCREMGNESNQEWFLGCEQLVLSSFSRYKTKRKTHFRRNSDSQNISKYNYNAVISITTFTLNSGPWKEINFPQTIQNMITGQTVFRLAYLKPQYHFHFQLWKGNENLGSHSGFVWTHSISQSSSRNAEELWAYSRWSQSTWWTKWHVFVLETTGPTYQQD